jgi:trigger factor
VNVQVSKTGPCAAKVSLSVPAAEFQQQFALHLGAASKKARVKGFRAGHVPPSVVEKLYGDAVQRETIEHYLKTALEKAVSDEKLDLAIQPQVSGGKGWKRGMDLELDLELDLKPSFQLGTYKGLAVERRAVKVEDGEVDKTIEDVRRQQARPKPAGDAGLPATDGMAIGRIELLHDGNVVATREGLRLAAELPPTGADEAQWKEKLTGAREGAVLEVAMTFAPEWEQEELRGKPGVCRVTLSQVFALELPSREDLQKMFGAQDDAEFVAKVEEQLQAAKEEQERLRVEAALFDALMEAHPFELPPRMLANQVEARLMQARQQMVQSGVAEADAKAKVEEQRAATESASQRSLRAYFLVEAVSVAENLRVNQSEITAELRRIATRNRATFQQVAKYYEENKLVPQLGVELMERKVRAFLREHAAP